MIITNYFISTMQKIIIYLALSVICLVIPLLQMSAQGTKNISSPLGDAANPSSPEKRLQELGIILPQAPKPIGNYVPAITDGNRLLFTAGMICLQEDQITHAGKLGQDFTIEEGYQAARICGLNLLAAIKGEVGSLDEVEKFITVTGFVNATPDFHQSPQVINGASDLIVEVFGEQGKHARAAISVANLPLNSAVEVQAVVRLKNRPR